MSYDIVLQRFRNGESVAIDADPVWTLLEAAWDAPPDEFDHCRVRRGEDEGDLYSVQPGDPFDALTFTHAEPAIYDLMFEVAAAGELTIIPPDVGPFVLREEQREHLPPELREKAMLVHSGSDLLRAIEEA